MMKNIVIIFMVLFGVLFTSDAYGQTKKYILKCSVCDPILDGGKNSNRATEFFNGLEVYNPDGSVSRVYAPYSVAVLNNTIYLQSLTIKSSFVDISLNETLYTNMTEFKEAVFKCKSGAGGVSVTTDEDGNVIITNPPDPTVTCEDCDPENEISTYTDNGDGTWTIDNGIETITLYDSTCDDCDATNEISVYTQTSDSTWTIHNGTETITITDGSYCTDCSDKNELIQTFEYNSVTNEYEITENNIVLTADAPCKSKTKTKTFQPTLDEVTYSCPIPTDATNVVAYRRGKRYCSPDEFTWDGTNITWGTNNLHADVTDNCQIKVEYNVCE